MKRVVISEKLFNKAIAKDVESYPYRRCVLVTCGQTDRVRFVVPH